MTFSKHFSALDFLLEKYIFRGYSKSLRAGQGGPKGGPGGPREAKRRNSERLKISQSESVWENPSVFNDLFFLRVPFWARFEDVQVEFEL